MTDEFEELNKYTWDVMGNYIFPVVRSDVRKLIHRSIYRDTILIVDSPEHQIRLGVIFGVRDENDR